MSIYHKVVKSDADMLMLLQSMKGVFQFHSVSFEADVDLHLLLSEHPVEGIGLLGAGAHTARPSVLTEVNPMLNFSDLVFDFPVSFISCKFETEVGFSNLRFKQGLDICYSKFSDEVHFRNVVADGSSRLVFDSSSSVMIVDSSFDLYLGSQPAMKVEKTLHIENTALASGINLTAALIGGGLNLIGNKVGASINLSSAKLSRLNIDNTDPSLENSLLMDLDLSHIQCSDQVQISNISFTGDLRSKGATFSGNVFLVKVEFLEKVYFTHCNFEKEIFFEKVKSGKIFSFSSSTFRTRLNLCSLDLSATDLYFSSAKIYSDVWLGAEPDSGPVDFNGLLNFRGAFISPESIVRIYGLNSKRKPKGKLIFSNGLIKGFLDVKDVYVSSITFDATIVLGNIQENNTLITAIHDRPTARLLKHESKRVNNSISAVAYNKLEMQLHRKEMDIRSLGDLLILSFNRISNNYGTSWLLGVLFTFFGGLLCFVFFEVCRIDFAFFWEDSYSCILLSKGFWSRFIDYFWLPAGFKQLTEADGLVGGLSGLLRAKLLLLTGFIRL